MIEKVTKVLGNNLCDHCLGRLYSQLLHGHTNEDRGRTIRKFVAMMVDGGFLENPMNPDNFYGLEFNLKKNINSMAKKEKCWLCNNIFDDLDSMVKKAEKKLKKIEFNNFLVGSKVPNKILEREEKLWEISGIDFVETIKSEINREMGKRLGYLLDKETEFRNPEVVVTADFAKKKVKLLVNSLYILGYYQKLKRGMPQSKWGTPGKYKTSVQETIAKPFMKTTKGSGNAFHGMGREDIDARCLGWRPFVIEIEGPVKRKISLRDAQKKINKTGKVKVKKLKFSNKSTIIKLKSAKGDKTYRVKVIFEKPVKRTELRKLKKLLGSISQRTPQRVSHRRADLIRKRKVKEIKYKFLNRKRIELTVKGAAGLYIKELVSGDNGRTRPSVSSILGVKATPKDLDVIKVEPPKNL